MNKFDRDYYENGLKSGVSGYENYRWMPTRSIPEAISIIDHIGFHTAIDFGCAKGFLVHALNLLGKIAIGFDISEYAIENCLPQVKGKVFHLDGEIPEEAWSDLLIAKDVLEHIPEGEIPLVLKNFRKVCDTALLVIPLGDNDSFRIREYELDKTHVTRKDEEWWISQIEKAGFSLQRFSYSLGAVKEKWADYKFGNGFFTIS